MIERSRDMARLRELLDWNPVVAITGARQTGKTTLARQLAGEQESPTAFFDLENPDDLAKLSEPMLALAPLRGLVILDEIQRFPALFQVLRVLADRPERPATFLVLGSASPELLRQSSETLAGRISYHELGGLALDEVGAGELNRLWLRGGFPRSFLAASDARSLRWREDFIQTFLERDLPQLGISIASDTLRRFWMMVAHYHGQVWNGSELARSLAVSEASVRRYLDLLTSAAVLDQLQPLHENVAKRQVKSPKVFVSDSGLLHALLGIASMENLTSHPKLGASWEGFAMRQVIRQLDLSRRDCYFWATYSGAEIDLVVGASPKRWGIEFKRTSQPRVTPSMRIAIETLGLRTIQVIHAGSDSFPLSEAISAVALANIDRDLRLE